MTTADSTPEPDETPAVSEDHDAAAILAEPTGPIPMSWDILDEETWRYETVHFNVIIRRLQTIQMMKLLKIVTTGLRDQLDVLTLDPEDLESSIGSMIAAVGIALPDAVKETTDFVRSMVELVPDTSGFQPGNNKHAAAANAENVKAQRAIFDLAFKNPDLDALMAIIEHVLRTEGPHLAALGKRLVDLFNQIRPRDTSK